MYPDPPKPCIKMVDNVFQYNVGDIAYVGSPTWTRAEKGVIQKRILNSLEQPVYQIYFEGSNRHTQWVVEEHIHVSYLDALEKLVLNRIGKENEQYLIDNPWKPEPQLFCEEVRAPNHLVPRRDQYIEPVKYGGPSKPSNQTMESYMEKDLEQQSAQSEYEQEWLANKARDEAEFSAYMETKAGELHDLNETQEILEMLLKAFRDDEAKWNLKVDEVIAQRNAVSRKTRLIENLLQDGEIKKRKIKHDLGIS